MTVLTHAELGHILNGLATGDDTGMDPDTLDGTIPKIKDLLDSHAGEFKVTPVKPKALQEYIIHAFRPAVMEDVLEARDLEHAVRLGRAWAAETWFGDPGTYNVEYRVVRRGVDPKSALEGESMAHFEVDFPEPEPACIYGQHRWRTHSRRNTIRAHCTRPGCVVTRTINPKADDGRGEHMQVTTYRELYGPERTEKITQAVGMLAGETEDRIRDAYREAFVSNTHNVRQIHYDVSGRRMYGTSSPGPLDHPGSARLFTLQPPEQWLDDEAYTEDGHDITDRTSGSRYTREEFWDRYGWDMFGTEMSDALDEALKRLVDAMDLVAKH